MWRVSRLECRDLKKNGDLVKTPGKRPYIPHHRRRFQMGFGIALCVVMKSTELQRIANESTGVFVWPVMSQLPSSCKLERKTAGALGVRGTFFARNR